MKAIVLEKPGQMRAVTIEPPGEPGPGEALVRVRRVGICGTDLHAFRGTQPYFEYPRIVGHELGVEVLAVGDSDQRLAAGDLCALEPSFHCGQCIACRRGRSNCCVNLKVFGVHVDGGMRERFIVPVSNLHKSTTLTPEQLSLVEPLCIGAHAVRRAALEPGDTVLIIGAGPIGLAVAQSARLHDVTVVIMDVLDERLAFARETLGIQHSIDGRREPLEQLRSVLGGELATVVFDCTGNKQSMEQALTYMAHGGKLVFVGIFLGDMTFNDPTFHRKETTLLSSRNATAEDFREIIARMEKGEIDVLPWITHRALADELPGVFSTWVRGEANLFKASVEW